MAHWLDLIGTHYSLWHHAKHLQGSNATFFAPYLSGASTLRPISLRLRTPSILYISICVLEVPTFSTYLTASTLYRNHRREIGSSLSLPYWRTAHILVGEWYLTVRTLVMV